MDEDTFTCIDCERKLQAAEAAYDVRQDGELIDGTICLDCVDDLTMLVDHWPSRETA